ncbi:hypothetical protein [Fenollaria sporofastidiosus]|uniref:hypothetical protein n=1 Tax=Fenollaria sporofastidiosus TaxID=2811778 RepID=UPI001C005DAC|nr:hypothetical protein [Fenollaria sporofastidiosus]
MKRYIMAFVVFTMLFFSTISIVKAEDCIEIPGDVVESRVNYQFQHEPPKLHDKAPGKSELGKGVAEVVGFDANGEPIVETTFDVTDKNLDMSTTQTDLDAVYDKRNSNTHHHDVEYPNVPKEQYTQESKVVNNKVISRGIATKGGETEKSQINDSVADAKEYENLSAEEAAAKCTTLKPGTKAYDNFIKEYNTRTPAQLRKEGQNQRNTRQITQVMKIQRPPTKVCKGDPGWDLCERFASMPDPSPRTCHNGTFTPAKGACKAYTRDDPISSYTTRDPKPTQPMIKDEDWCSSKDKNQINFETAETLKKYSGTIKANQNNMQDKVPSLVTQFNEELWTSKYQSEDRFWNPFQEGVISSGLPIKTRDNKYYTVELDSWEDREYRPNSFLPDSIEYVRKKEAINDTVVKKYNGSNINIYNNAPNPKVTHRYLDGKVWKDLYSTNIECGMRYKLLVDPKYDITEHIRYQHKQVREIYGREKVSTYDCEPYRCTKRRKTGTQHWSEWRQEYVDDYETYETTCYYTCCYLEDDNQKQEWNDGETQSSHKAGEIPPVYAPRVKWRYRIGVGNEYHASAKRLTDKAKLTPVPNSKDTQKMKSGYGFKYSGDKWKIVTDYDEPQFKNESDVIRPNKNVALKLTGNIKSQTEYFDPNVKYNSAKNAPERSSSKDSRYIEERIKANKIKSDFNKNAISKFVSKTKDDSSLLRIRPYTKDSSVSGEKIIYRGKAINMETQFESQSDPNKYYHAYWVTKGEPNLIPAYKQAPLHYVHLDYPSGTMYDIYSINRTYIRNGFTIDAYNTGSIKIVGNMWEDSFSRPNFKK